MTHKSAIRIALVAGTLAIVGCSNPSDKNGNAMGANVGATTTPTSRTTDSANGADTGHAATDSANKAATSGNPTGASSTRPTKP